MPENRENNRKSCLVDIHYSDGRTDRHWLSDNISLGGMFIRTASPEALDSEITLSFELDGAPFKVSAKVIWRNEKGMGVKFITTQQDYMRRVSALADAIGVSGEI